MRHSTLRMPPNIDHWSYEGYRGAEKIYASWALRGAEMTEAAVYLELLEKGHYTNVKIVFVKGTLKC